MNVVLVINGIHAGGGGRVMTWLAGRLVDAGHRVTLVVRAASASDFFEVDPRVQVVRAGLLPRWLGRVDRLPDVALAWGVRRICRRTQADVVVSFIRQVNLAVVAGLVGSGIPVIVSERSHPFAYTDLGPVRRRLRPFLYRRAAGVVVLTDEIAEMARRRWRVRTVDVIPNAAPTRKSQPPPMSERDRIVLSVGRLNHLKGHIDLVTAWSLTSAATRGWRLQVVGDGPMRPELEETVRRLGLDDSVDLVGQQADTTAIYATASVFVLPSLVEGYPNALLEAMAAGCACIATDCPGATREILADDERGILVQVGTPDELAWAIDRLTQDDAERERLGEAARRGVEHPTADEVFARWHRLLVRAERPGRWTPMRPHDEADSG